MRRRLVFLVFLGMAAIGIYGLQKGKYAPSEVPSSGPSPATEPSPPAAQVTTRTRTHSIHAVRKVSQQHPNEFDQRPKDNVIHFKVEEGWAVAYDDILIGKPEPGFEGKSGWADSPAPQYWERPEIPFLIDPDLAHPDRVERAIEYFQSKTPIRFMPYSGQTDGIYFTIGEKHCASLLGKVGGLQPIRLASGCGDTEVLHEIMHALGFIHEHSRGDRDRYIEVLWNNIEEENKAQFAIVPESFEQRTRDLPFDFESVMLYTPDSFAIRQGLLTLQARDDRKILPVKQGLSDGDLRKVNQIYGLFD